jgi:uncharacterized protein YlxW (UPF0749 family)
MPEPDDTVSPAPASGRDALVVALKSRPSRAQLPVAVLLFAVGFAAATQVRSNEQDDQFASLRQSELIGAFDGLAGSTERAENAIEELTQTKEDLQNATSSREAALQAARDEQAVLAILAGAVPTTGPGIRITINDPQGLVSANLILDLIQELRSSGAEAMEVNDRIRVIAQTSIEQTEDGIELDGQLLEAPYIIDAVGEPAALDGTLGFTDGPIDRVEDAQGTLEHDQLDDVLVASVVETEEADFADPQDER